MGRINARSQKNRPSCRCLRGSSRRAAGWPYYKLAWWLFNLFMGSSPTPSPILQLNEVEKKLFETEERADMAEEKVSQWDTQHN